MKTMSILAALAVALGSTVALAQSPPPAATAPAKPAPAAPTAAAPAAPAVAKVKKERTAESLKCSAEADAKALKGAERKKFRSKCMSDAKKAAAAAGTPAPAKKN